jgi:hypothetical protein
MLERSPKFWIVFVKTQKVLDEEKIGALQAHLSSLFKPTSEEYSLIHEHLASILSLPAHQKEEPFKVPEVVVVKPENKENSGPTVAPTDSKK